MASWFRFYLEAVHDPKLLALSDPDYRMWVNILCLSAPNNGKLPSFESIALSLRADVDAIRTVVERLANATLIDRAHGGPNGWHYAVHGWAKRQYKSDTSTDRVKRFRNAKRNVSETPSESETESDTEKTPLPPSAPPAEDGGVIFSEPEMREGNGDGFVPSESDRNAIFAAATRFHTKHADPRSTEAERQVAFADWMGKWISATAAGDFERELALSRTAYDIYPALQAAARKQTEVSNGEEGSEDAGEAGVEEGATDGSHKPRRGRRRRVGIGAVDSE